MLSLCGRALSALNQGQAVCATRLSTIQAFDISRFYLVITAVQLLKSKFRNELSTLNWTHRTLTARSGQRPHARNTSHAQHTVQLCTTPVITNEDYSKHTSDEALDPTALPEHKQGPLQGLAGTQPPTHTSHGTSLPVARSRGGASSSVDIGREPYTARLARLARTA